MLILITRKYQKIKKTVEEAFFRICNKMRNSDEQQKIVQTQTACRTASVTPMVNYLQGCHLTRLRGEDSAEACASTGDSIWGRG